MIKTYFSCAELAEMKLLCLPGTARNILSLAVRHDWLKKKRDGRGGGFEYQPPKEIMDLIRGQLINTAIQTIPTEKSKSLAVSAPVKSTELKDWQRDIAEARAAICAEVKRLSAIGGTERAIRSVIDMAALGTLPTHLQQLVQIANAKAGVNRALSRTSIYRWLNDQENGLAGLAPKAVVKSEMPAWANALISLMANPQKPTLKACMQELGKHLPPGVEAPSYWSADRFLKKMSKVDVQRGRMGSRELKNIQPFVRRDTSQMWPGDAYTADGHTFDAEIAHRDHGRAFRPEITTVLDIATRRVTGWSTGLAESTWTVLDALRHACTSSGIPAIFYVDNGSGFKNAAMSNEATGFMARLGITLTHSTPYNSQARGIIERVHQTIWVKGAKQLPTYMGADMDAQAKQKVFKLTRADLKKTGSSKLLVPWNIFVKWCQEQVDNYNNSPHSSLPKVRDPITGNKRHQTPNEAWAAAIAEGWQPTLVEASEADDLFRPYKDGVKVLRGEIQLHNNKYFSHELEHYHGEAVRVGYDLHDANRVWVRNKAGQLICVAEFEANKRSYFPESFIQQAAQKRAEGRIKRAEAKIEEAQAELDAPLLLEQQTVFEMPGMTINPPCETDHLEKVSVQTGKTSQAEIIELPTKVTRPMFDTQASKYRWLLQNHREITNEDEAWLDYYRVTAEWEELFGHKEVATR